MTLGIGAATEVPSMEPVQFTLEGDPVPKARPRFRINGKPYTPKRTLDYERAIGQAAMVARMGAQMPLGPVVVVVEAVQAAPGSYTKAQRLEAIHGLRTPRWDLDNVVKAVLDGCNGVLWLDDRQVKEIQATKGYGETGYLKVTVR